MPPPKKLENPHPTELRATVTFTMSPQEEAIWNLMAGRFTIQDGGTVRPATTGEVARAAFLNLLKNQALGV